MSAFLTDLISVAPCAGQGYYSFAGADGEPDGFVQIIPWANGRITIYRLWTRRPGEGKGAKMLRALSNWPTVTAWSWKSNRYRSGESRIPFPETN